MNKLGNQNLKLSNGGAKGLDLICLSHLRWNFVYQRPQHLLSRACKNQRVFFFEEPIFHDHAPQLQLTAESGAPFVAVPYLPHGLSEAEQNQALRRLLDQLIKEQGIEAFISWYYTPMALKYSRHLRPDVCVYDCMDQLSHFKGASREIPLLEQELFRKADVVFTGGQSLFESKRDQHHNVHAFPSSVDVTHFAKARQTRAAVQTNLPGPKIGYLGVIDERIDIDLIDEIARLRPDWQLIMVGPIVKIDTASLPQHPNIHYLGGKSYAELPQYLADWDIAILPFARNDATRFISPTKTPEYLSAGKRVISTSIRDVVNPYGDKNLVAIADSAAEFVKCAAQLLAPDSAAYQQWLSRVDEFLSLQSWDRTFESMWRLLDKSLVRKQARAVSPILSQTSALFNGDIAVQPAVAASSSNLSGKVAMAPG